MKKHQELIEWLKELVNVERDTVEPVTVQIGRTAYIGARYTNRLSGLERIYLIGETPAAYRRSGNLAFIVEGEAHEWYIASYYDVSVKDDPRYAPFHPFGANFQIAPWIASDGRKIDDYLAPRTYRRMKIAITQGLNETAEGETNE